MTLQVRDKSRSVNSVDVVFNFDCIGFTGTPFIDNYPSFEYIRSEREDAIPDLIDRSFYAYSSEVSAPVMLPPPKYVESIHHVSIAKL